MCEGKKPKDAQQTMNSVKSRRDSYAVDYGHRVRVTQPTDLVKFLFLAKSLKALQ